MTTTTTKQQPRPTGPGRSMAMPLHLTGLVLAASAFHVPIGYGQTSSYTTLEEIVVTARRREEVLQDIPVAVTALSADYLRVNNISEFESLGYHVPSFRVSTSNGTTNLPNISLRGQRPSEMQMATDPAVPMYFADVVMTPAHGSNLAMYDLESVQVLKGPQGTLFGRNSTGGAVLLTPRRPGDSFGGHIEAELGNHDLIKVEGAVDLPINDALKFRLAGRSIDRDGYQTNVADNALKGKKFWDEDSFGLRLTMDLDLGDLTSTIILSHDENDMLARLPIPLAFNPQGSLGGLYNSVHNGGLGIGGPAVDDAIERQRRRDGMDIETDMLAAESVKNTFFANTTEYRLSDNLSLKNIIGFRKVDTTASNNADGMAVPLLGSITSLSDRVTRNPPESRQDAEQFSEELQLLGTALDDRLDWITGLYWYRMKGSQTTPTQLMGANLDWPAGEAPVPQLAPVWGRAQNGVVQDSPRGDVKNESHAVFGQFSYALNDQWSFSLGARQTWDDRSITARNLTANPVTWQAECGMYGEDGARLPDDACGRRVDKSFSNFTWHTAVDYKPRDGMLFYGSIATGHRSGGFNMRGTDSFTLMPFDEEQVITYELGHKAEWNLGGQARLRTNLAVYLQDYEDIQKAQAILVDGVFGSAIVNAAKAEIKGVEFDVLFAPTANLALSFSWAHVDASYDEWDVQEQIGRDPVTGAPIVIIRDNSDAVFDWLPKSSLTGSIKYTLPLDPRVGDISATASVYWQDDMYTYTEYKRWLDLNWSRLDDIWETRKVDGYAVWNLRLDWRSVHGSGVDIAVYINNVADEEPIVGGNNNLNTLGLATAVLGPPRTFGAAVRWNF